mmetsp:Transcript_15658/g.24041  ORF Transcript_15658/g.24041 Transcript_15658/m.24041 type:complete len:388 (+) Transcript_15658:194-1357(+)
MQGSEHLYCTMKVIFNSRSFLFDSLDFQHFLSLLPQDLRRKKETNELIATILTSISSSPYNIEFEDSKRSSSENLFEHMPAPPLTYWSFDHWEALSDLLFQLMSKIGAKEDSGLETVMQSISLNQKLAKIRSRLEEQLINDKSGPVKIQDDLLNDFLISCQTDDESVQKALITIFVEIESGKKTSSPNLKQLQDLEPIFRSEPFEFGHFIGRVDQLIGIWSWRFVPSLKELLSGTSKEKKEELQFGTISNDSSKSESVVDDISHKKTKVSSNTQEGGIHIIDDDEEEGFMQRNSSNTTTKRKRIKNSPSRKISRNYRQNPIAPPRPDRRSRRVPWTEEEKTAVRQGVRDYRVGEWAKIKSKYKVELANRTSVQIKDQYRTMCKRGES